MKTVVLSTSTGECSSPSREALCWSLSKFHFFPVVAVWMWHLFLLAELISCAERTTAEILQSKIWLKYSTFPVVGISIGEGSRPTESSCVTLFWMFLPEAWLAHLLRGGGKAVSKKPLDPIAKMPEPFGPSPALSDVPSWILRAVALDDLQGPFQDKTLWDSVT